MAPPSRRGREEAKAKEGRRVTIQPSQEPVLLSGVNAADERLSWRAAVVSMVVLSAVTSLAYAFNVNPFAFSFNLSFVYLPTAVLILGPLVTKARRKSRRSA